MANHLLDGLRTGSKDGSRPFLESNGTTLSYSDIWARSAQMARALVSLGVQPGDRVAVQAVKSVEMVSLYLACIRTGGIFLPLNTAYTSAEIGYFIADAEPVLLVNNSGTLALPGADEGAYLPRILSMAALSGLADGMEEGFEDVSRAADDLAAILYTSGTTGRSKGAMLSHDNLLSNALTLKEHWRFTDADRLIHALPIFHAHGLFVALNVALVAGSALIFQTGFNADDVIDALPRATTFMGVPTFYTRLLQHPDLTASRCAGMRLFISGSAPLLPETHRVFRTRTGHAILERYGMTETIMNSSNPYVGERRPGTVGQPLPRVEIRICDPRSGALLPQGETGMIEVRGPNVFKGYWRMPEKTAAEFAPGGFFRSGDLGMFDAEGYLHIVGRAKDLIISGGYNVYPKEIEAEIDLLDAVEESAVIGLPHPDFGEGVTAVVVLKPNQVTDERQVLQALSARLARYKQPKRVIFVADLPRNTMGKVQKNVLRDSYLKLYTAWPPAGAPVRKDGRLMPDPTLAFPHTTHCGS